MEANEQPEEIRRAIVPDYVPARMLNEFIYCPRLFFYEWVEGVFQESADAVEGKAQHKRVDEKATELPSPENLGDETIRSRSVTMSSDHHGVIARMDLVEVDGSTATPVDYKHGDPRETDSGIELWPTDRIQLAAQGLILRDNGYRCDEGLVYYFKTKQRVRVSFDESLMAEVVRVIGKARAAAGAGCIPPPLEDSPKCQGCSLAGICLPDETIELSAHPSRTNSFQLLLFGGSESANPTPAATGVRMLVTPRDDLRPAYLNTQGMRVGKSGEVLQAENSTYGVVSALS
jgi:CRISPR-associated protein Cas4